MSPKPASRAARARRRHFISLVLSAIGSVLACDIVQRPAGRRSDDNASASDATLVLRQSIGEDNASSPDYQFSAIVAMLMTADEKLWVVDGYNSSTPQVRMYHSDGNFLRNVGTVGSGPGEYRNPNALALLGDGRVVLRDQGLADRITIYTANGALDTTWVLRGKFPVRGTGPRIVVDTLGLMWIAFGSPPGPTRLLAYLRIHNGSIVDTVWLPPLPRLLTNGVRVERRLASGGLSVAGVHPPYQAQAVWALSPQGRFAVARTDQYRIEFLAPYGVSEGWTDTISRVVDLVPVSDAERRDRHDHLAERMRAIGATRRRVPEVPRYKPPIKRLVFSSDGQLLVSVSMPSRFMSGKWTEPTAYDVFDQSRRFRGRIRLPDGFTLGYLKGDDLWGVWRDDYGVEFIRRYHVRWPVVSVSSLHPP